MFEEKELQRYKRHFLLDAIGERGQAAFKQATVVIIGAGGLGSPAALYLAAAGIGNLRLIDHDQVDMSNLQRQILYKANHVGKSKVDSAQKTLGALNSFCHVETKQVQLTASNAESLLQDADVVLDCCDDLSTRLLINRSCFTLRKPLVSGAAIRLEGQLAVYDFRDKSQACYQCFVGENPIEPVQSCATSGVLGPILGMIGSAQALEALKIIADLPIESSVLRIFDGLQMRWMPLKITKNSACSVCG